MSNPVMYNGKMYSSLRKLCKIKGVKYSTVHTRVSQGRPIEEALSEERFATGKSAVKRARKGTEIEINGVKYRSLSEACRALDINVSTITQRMKYGYSVQEAFNFDKCRKKRDYGRKDSPFVFNGREYSSVRNFCRANALEDKYEQIVARKRQGEDIADIVASLRDRNSIINEEVVYRGVTYKNYKDFCKKNDCLTQYGTLLAELKNGKSFENIVDKIEKIKAERKEKFGNA